MNRRGNAIIGALTLIPMLGFASLSVDIGAQKVINTQLQVMADAATLSGANMLNGTSEGVNAAATEVIQVASQNTVFFGYQPSLEEVRFGKYEDGVFSELSSVEPGEINAIQMQPIHTYSSILAVAAYGVLELSSGASSIAVRPVGGTAKHVDCYLPFAIPTCHFNDLGQGENPAPISLDLANLNTVGWSGVDTNPNTNYIKRQILNQCQSGAITVYTEDDGETRQNILELSNGQNNSAVNIIGDIINDRTSQEPNEWPSEYFPGPYMRDNVSANLAQNSIVAAGNWGNNISGVVPIVDHECGSQFVGDARIVGWTYVYIYDGKTKGSGGKNIWMQFDFINEYELGTGNVHDGVGNVAGTMPPTLVR
jgi:hypothetical protein